jgi:DNA-directed RNA polymerase subunit alpha
VSFQIECVESKTEVNYSQYGKFLIDSLERGQGTTLGNALRRVLLSNLTGTAITAVRIAGLVRVNPDDKSVGRTRKDADGEVRSATVNHEFATLVGVREDVLELMLNMKEIVLKSFSEDRQRGRLEIIGPKTVVAGDFDLPSEIEVVNPKQYVATVAEGGKLEMEFWIERGRGYRPVEKFRDRELAIDELQIDATFMPVHKVNYVVDEFRAEGNLDRDRLSLEIWTNGSISPQESLSESAGILVELLAPLKDISLEPFASDRPHDDDPIAQTPIEELNLSVRAYNCLKRAQINSVADLLHYSQEDLLEIKNFGQKSAEEVIEALEKSLGIILPLEKTPKQ